MCFIVVGICLHQGFCKEFTRFPKRGRRRSPSSLVDRAMTDLGLYVVVGTKGGWVSTRRRCLGSKEDDVVGVFNEVHGQLERIKVAEWRHHDEDEGSAKEHAVLHANSTPYHRRGWCIAEREWSNARSQSSQAPMLPARFCRKAETGDYTFGHPADFGRVAQLHSEVFESRAPLCKKFRNSDLLEPEVVALSAALPMFLNLTELYLGSSFLGDAEQQLAEAVASLARLEVLTVSQTACDCRASGAFLLKAIAKTRLSRLCLEDVGLHQEGYVALASSLQQHPSLERLDLSNSARGAESGRGSSMNSLCEEGAQALAAAFRQNQTLRALHLRSCLE
ncbi:unnamed protein product, partial [Symbiodinium microadriaticum]